MSNTKVIPEGIAIEQVGERIIIRVQKETVPSHLGIEFQNDSTTGVKAAWGKVTKVVLDCEPDTHYIMQSITVAIIVLGLVALLWLLKGCPWPF